MELCRIASCSLAVGRYTFQSTKDKLNVKLLKVVRDYADCGAARAVLRIVGALRNIILWGPIAPGLQASCTVQGCPSVTIKVAIDCKNIDCNNKCVIF